MAFSNGGYLNWLQSTLDDKDYARAEGSTSYQHHDPDQEVELWKCPDSTNLMGQDHNNNIDYNQLWNQYVAAVSSGINFFDSSGVVQDLRGLFDQQADESASAEIILQPTSPQPSFSSILPMGKNISLNNEWHPSESEWNKLKELNRATCSAFIGEDDNNTMLSDSTYNALSPDGVPSMFEDHQEEDVNFSSWLLFENDDSAATFREVLSESTSNDKQPQLTVDIYNENNPTAILRNNSHDKDYKDYIVPESRPQASKALSRRKSQDSTIGEAAVHRTASKALSRKKSQDSTVDEAVVHRTNDHLVESLLKDCSPQQLSHLQKQLYLPLFDYEALSDPDFRIQEATFLTNTPASSARHLSSFDYQPTGEMYTIAEETEEDDD
ncbi:hypothetical protein MBANPS3_001266 [Mucor bainieri]